MEKNQRKRFLHSRGFDAGDIRAIGFGGIFGNFLEKADEFYLLFCIFPLVKRSKNRYDCCRTIADA